jgi:hypothetical protein
MKRLVLALMLVAALAFVANATEPPAPPAGYGTYLPGWGMTNFNWQDYSGSFSSLGVYDPNYLGFGDSWVVGYGAGGTPMYIAYAPITLDLWIEMYCLQTYHYTSYQWHRLGNALETITFIVEGTLSSNNGQWVSLVGPLMPQTMDKLYFLHNIFGGQSPAPPAPDITPLTWEGQWGTGLVYGVNVSVAWGPLTPAGSIHQQISMLIPDPSEHWFQFRGTYTIPYHQPDGHYNLTLAGCPAPEL